MKYTVLELVDEVWTLVLETYNEREAVAKHRQLQKQGKIAIIDYEE